MLYRVNIILNEWSQEIINKCNILPFYYFFLLLFSFDCTLYVILYVIFI